MLFSFIRSALILWITLHLSCLLRLWESSWLMRRDSLSLELRPDLDLPPQTDSSCSWSRGVYVVFYWHQQIFRSRRYVWAGTSHSGFMLAHTHGFITAAVLNTCCQWDSVQLSHQLHNCLWLCLPHTEVNALSVQLCGDYAAHRAALYQHTACVLPLITVVDSCFCDYDHFSPAQWKDRLKVELVEAQRKVWKETGCFHITQDIPLIFLFFRDLSLQCTPVRRLWHVHNHTLFHCCLQHQLNSYTHNTL